MQALIPPHMSSIRSELAHLIHARAITTARVAPISKRCQDENQSAVYRVNLVCAELSHASFLLDGFLLIALNIHGLQVKSDAKESRNVIGHKKFNLIGTRSLLRYPYRGAALHERSIDSLARNFRPSINTIAVIHHGTNPKRFELKRC